MAAEYEQLYLKTLLGQDRDAVGDHVNDTVDFLQTTETDYRWDLLHRGLDRAAETIREGRPVLYYVVDDTSRGGRHAIEAVYTPTNGRVMIGVPELSRDDQKGHFPTMLHTLEYITETVQKANGGVEEKTIPYPQVFFAPNDENRVSRVVMRNIPDIETVMVPLTVDPPMTNAIFVHTQARHIDPETLIRAYYEVIKQDPILVEHVMRHTMLFHPLHKAIEQPPTKQQAIVEVLPHGKLQGHKLVDLRRVQPWNLHQPNHEVDTITIQKDLAGRSLIPIVKQES